MAAAGKGKKTTKKVSKASSGVETNLVRRVTLRPANTNIADFRSGDTVSVFVKVKEGEKERVQAYKGVVTKIQGSGASRSFTVRKISEGVGVERTFPFTSPAVDRVEIVSHGQVRRSRLFYLRGLDGKAAKIESTLATKASTKSAQVPKVAAE